MIRAAISIIIGLILAASVPIAGAYIGTGHHPTSPIANPFGEGHRATA
jgi:hypothetical protein